MGKPRSTAMTSLWLPELGLDVLVLLIVAAAVILVGVPSKFIGHKISIHERQRRTNGFGFPWDHQQFRLVCVFCTIFLLFYLLCVPFLWHSDPGRESLRIAILVHTGMLACCISCWTSLEISDPCIAVSAEGLQP